jgi:hypothetical protein
VRIEKVTVVRFSPNSSLGTLEVFLDYVKMCRGHALHFVQKLLCSSIVFGCFLHCRVSEKHLPGSFMFVCRSFPMKVGNLYDEGLCVTMETLGFHFWNTAVQCLKEW